MSLVENHLRLIIRSRYVTQRWFTLYNYLLSSIPPAGDNRKLNFIEHESSQESTDPQPQPPFKFESNQKWFGEVIARLNPTRIIFLSLESGGRLVDDQFPDSLPLVQLLGSSPVLVLSIRRTLFVPTLIGKPWRHKSSSANNLSCTGNPSQEAHQ